MSESDGARQTFDVELLIVHPTLDPAEITSRLGLEGHITHRVGDQRSTPKGTPLPGRYRDTRWRHSVRHRTDQQWFAEAVRALVDQLKPHKAFLSKLRSTGGKACLLIQFLGDGYFGDQLDRDILKDIVDLDLDFGIECYSVPQV